MNTRIFVPRDTAAIAVGADDVASAITAQAQALGLDVQIVRNGSRGLLWLETLVEIDTPAGRIAYGPVQADDVPGLFEAGWLDGSPHPLRHGPTDEIPYLKNQERLTFARVGIIDPLSLADYQAHGGYAGLRNALAMAPEAIVGEVVDSGLRGRGGAAFPTGIKWKTVLATPALQKYVVCNADEGDSGTFSDRLLMEGDPYTLIEGMTIAGIAVGANYGYVYVRSEYPYAVDVLARAIEQARRTGWLGSDIQGSGRAFDMEVRTAAGAYICGEETSLLESLEGKRGLVRAKPPLPAIQGLFGQPTVINNVISLASVPIILDKGAAYYRDYGMGRSRGTLPFQLAGNLKRGGLVEKAFGLTLRQLLFDFGGGSASGRPLRAVQVGGPLGAYLPESQWDVPLDYEAYMGISAMLGHGGLVAFDDTVDMAGMAQYAMEFCAVESCGKCTPCRVGAVRGVEVIQKIRRDDQREHQVHLLRDLCDTMFSGSLCALGGMTPYPVLSALNHFPQDFGLPATQPASDEATA
ncbi:MAG: NADH-quinone oxidoreductase subunit NuoF [Candidimonas sp.]